MSRQYNMSRIRSLLLEGFSEDELRQLCFDVEQFYSLRDQLPNSTAKSVIVQELIAFAQRKGLLDLLLQEVKNLNPYQYDNYFPYYVHYKTLRLYWKSDSSIGHSPQLIKSFASLIKVNDQDIRVYHSEDSKTFDLGIPADAIQSLSSILQSENAKLRHLGIRRVFMENDLGEWVAFPETGERQHLYEFTPYSQSAYRNRINATNDRIMSASMGEAVKFVAITGRGFMCRKPRPAEPNVFVEAITRGVKFYGILLDPESEYAKIRSEIETPDQPLEKRLLIRDAAFVKNWLIEELEEKLRASAKRSITITKPTIKYCSLPLPFSLWLFDDFALVEPYHFGKFAEAEHLCGFGSIRVERNTHEYSALQKHFDLLWNRSMDIHEVGN